MPTTRATAEIAVIILAAGHGSRMKSKTPKVLHKIGGREMLGHVIDTSKSLNPQKMAVVIGDHAPQTGDYARGCDSDIFVAIQAPPQGTGDAVKQAVPAIADFSGIVLVLYADTPLVTTDTLKGLADEIENGATVAVLGFSPEDPGGYGRLRQDSNGALDAIVEARDATAEELKITLCNSGVMAFSAAFLNAEIGNIKNDNSQGEYYLTDLVAMARAAGKQCAIVEGSADEVIGVNARAELAQAEAIFQDRMRALAMIDGASLQDPQSVYFSYDTKLGQDVIIGANVIFGPGVEIADTVEIKPFSHLEGVRVAAGAAIGPFARLRPGADIKEGAKVGNFVEIKKATINAGAKVSHLTYIGDADVGAGANIGAGTITCNYDGYGKHKTTIGANAFIGSNSSLVAPVTIGEGAYVGSGSVITKDIDPGDLAVARGRQAAIKGWAARFHKAHNEGK